MKVIVTNNYQESCEEAAKIIINQVKNNPKSKLGLATGSSVLGIYDIIAESCKNGEVSFKDVTSVNLDEYVGLTPDHPQSYRRFMNDNLFNRIDIDKNNTYVPSGIADNIDEELKKFSSKILDGQQVDIQLLGVGVSGHIAFNEAGEELIADAHIENLDESTIKANARFFDSENEVPKQAFTMGIGEIMKAKTTLLIATGNKENAIRELLTNNKITTKCPVTMLKMHSDAVIIIDKELAEKAGYKA